MGVEMQNQPRFFFVLFSLSLVTLLNVPLTLGQVYTGDIVGTVTDETGAVVPGVDLTLRNAETNVTRINQEMSVAFLILSAPLR